MATSAGPTILPNERRGNLLGGWIGTLIFVAFIGFFWFVFLTGTPTGDAWVAYVVLGLFSFFCVAAVYQMTKVTLSVHRFGDVALKLRGTPRPGAAFEAHLDLRRHEVLTTVAIKLICNKVRWTRGSKGSRNRGETEHWSHAEPRAMVKSMGPNARVDLKFEIPGHLPGTTEPTGDKAEVQLDYDYFAWCLKLEADVPGVDLVRTYDVPVQGVTAATPAVPAAGDPAKLAAAGDLAEAELALGKRPAEVAGSLEGLGLSGPAIGELLRKLADRPGSKHASVLRPYLAARSRAQAEIDSGSLVMLKRRAAGPIAPTDAAGDWWRSPSALVLIAANIVPVAGVLVLGWPLLPVMLLFWFENVIVGFFNVLKMLTAAREQAGNVLLIPFFTFHYGIFCAVHGGFVVLLFGEEMLKDYAPSVGWSAILQPLSTVLTVYGLAPAVAALFASHAFSYFVNYLGRGEYRRADPGALMAAPYGRIVVLHLLILIGGFSLQALHSPAPLLALLVVLKTGLDLFAHRREHRRYLELAVRDTSIDGDVERRGGDEDAVPQFRIALSALIIVIVAGALHENFPAPAVRLPPEAAAAAQTREPHAATATQQAPPPGAFAGFELQPVPAPRPIWVAGRGLRAEPYTDDLRVHVAEIRLQKPAGDGTVEYTGAGLYLQRSDTGEELQGAFDNGIRGVLDQATPMVSIRGRGFVLRGMLPICRQAGCSARLTLTVNQGENVFFVESSQAAPLVIGQESLPAARAVPAADAPATGALLMAWQQRYELAMALRSQGQAARAEEVLRTILVAMESAPGGVPPEGARVLDTLAEIYLDQKKNQDYEAAMQRALQVLDAYDPMTVRVRLGQDGERIDKEVLAREFGDYYWDQYRYDRGFEYYRRAHDAAWEIDVTEEERNRRLAFSSAGVMATACVLKDFETADRAMQELKDRMQTVDPGSKKKLDYWVRTGEPRLKKRKC